MIASAKEIDALNRTLFNNSCINSTNVHLCNYCTKISLIVVNTCVCRRSVDNKALILSYPILSWEAVADLGEGSGGPPPLIFRRNTDAPAAIIGYHGTVTEKGGGVSEVGRNEQTTE